MPKKNVLQATLLDSEGNLWEEMKLDGRYYKTTYKAGFLGKQDTDKYFNRNSFKKYMNLS